MLRSPFHNFYFSRNQIYLFKQIELSMRPSLSRSSRSSAPAGFNGMILPTQHRVIRKLQFDYVHLFDPIPLPSFFFFSDFIRSVFFFSSPQSYRLILSRAPQYHEGEKWDTAIGNNFHIYIYFQTLPNNKYCRVARASRTFKYQPTLSSLIWS